MVALVTGASRGGTGRSVAIRFAAEGARVVVATILATMVSSAAARVATAR